MDSFTLALLGCSALLVFSVVASKTSFKIGVPTLIIFLAIGMLVGTDGLGIEIDDFHLAHVLGTIALNFILFSGGLDTKISSVKPVAGKGLSLATLGVFFTALLVGLFTYWITDFTFLESLLLGSIVSSTDAAAVFSIFRTQKAGLKRRLKDVIELESASNDPMAYFLTITIISIMQQGNTNYWLLFPNFVMQMFLGAVMGVVLGYLFVKLINKIGLDISGLYPVLCIGINLFVYSFTTYLGGNGFLAIYLCALVLGNSVLAHKKTLVMFYDGFAWLMQVVMFLALGLLVNPSEMIPYIGIGLAVSFFLMLVARPVASIIALIPFKMPFKDQVFVSWCGLRGAVPIVFATFALLADLPVANEIFVIVFFVVLTSMLIQGTTFVKFGRKLGLTKKEEEGNKFSFNEDGDFASELKEVVFENPDSDGKMIMDLKLPDGALVVYVKRGKQYITPTGSTVVQIGDKLLIMANDKATMDRVKYLFSKDILMEDLIDD
jgi:cell volume regulation protein A